MPKKPRFGTPAGDPQNDPKKAYFGTPSQKAPNLAQESTTQLEPKTEL